MAATKQILDFFDDKENLKDLLGRETTLSIDFERDEEEDNTFKFNNKEVDSLKVKTIGKAKYRDIIAPITLSFQPTIA